MILLILFAIASSVNCVQIQCIFADVNLIVVGKRYTCEVIFTEYSDIADVTSIIHSYHLSGRSNFNVEAFKADGIKFQSIFPRNLDLIFPNLISITLSGSQVSFISSVDLMGWPNLTVFSAERNQFVVLEGNLFEHTPLITRINFSSNKIENVGTNLLSNLNSLTYVDFRTNPCINTAAATPQLIASLKSQLVTKCPSLDPTEEPQTTITFFSSTEDHRSTEIIFSTSYQPNECLMRCSLNDEVDELSKKISELNEANIHQCTLNTRLLERMAELEKEIRESSQATTEQTATEL